MKDSEQKNNEFLNIKIAQTGDILRFALNEVNLKKKFHEIYSSLLKELKLKKKDAYLSSEDGKMVSEIDLNLTLKEIIKKFDLKLKLYYEKVL
jgi:hypothetical protein